MSGLFDFATAATTPPTFAPYQADVPPSPGEPDSAAVYPHSPRCPQVGQSMSRLSNTAKQSMRLRLAVHALNGGRCFYCGMHVRCGEEELPRDWLPARGGVFMVAEHAEPVARGGVNHIDNRLPSCAACNSAKGWLTVDEFRLLRGLRLGNPSYRFPGEDQGLARDWLCCHSQTFERDLFIHNKPWAAEAFSRGRALWKRARRPARPA